MTIFRRSRSRSNLPGALLLCASSLSASYASAHASAVIPLALFDFELEDVSAGSGYSVESAEDASQLAMATKEARRLLTQSGRYSFVDIGSSDAEPVKKHSLRWCNGCDAAIAQKLGAEQSLVGVINRVSRTEYTVQIQIRDARAGSVVYQKQSDLRMGANYSWSRGASSLIKEWLLTGQQQSSQ